MDEGVSCFNAYVYSCRLAVMQPNELKKNFWVISTSFWWQTWWLLSTSPSRPSASRLLSRNAVLTCWPAPRHLGDLPLSLPVLEEQQHFLEQIRVSSRIWPSSVMQIMTTKLQASWVPWIPSISTSAPLGKYKKSIRYSLICKYCFRVDLIRDVN